LGGLRISRDRVEQRKGEQNKEKKWDATEGRISPKLVSKGGFQESRLELRDLPMDAAQNGQE